MAQARNLILVGGTGTGKSHLAVNQRPKVSR
jgi:DNA replication protein DnaC